MRILHYLFGLPPVYVGGLVGYVCDLAEEQILSKETEGQVSVLVAGPIISKMKGQKIRNVTSKYQKVLGNGRIPIYEIVNALPVSYGRGISEPEYFMQSGDFRVYYQFLNKMTPELIHVHSLMGIHLEFFLAARQLNIPVVFSAHDYYGLCSRATFYCESGICQEEDWIRCGDCCANAFSYKKIVKEQSALYRRMKKNGLYQKVAFSQRLLPIKKMVRDLVSPRGEPEVGIGICDAGKIQSYVLLQKYYQKIFDNIFYFHFNSEETARIYKKRLGQVQGEVFPVLRRDIVDHRRDRVYNPILRIGYLGGNSRQKGFTVLFQATQRLWEDGYRDFEVQIYGNQTEEAVYLKKNAPYNREEIEKVYDRMDVLVVPSIWQETFGLVVAEAVSYGVPVIVSEYVGAKDILGDVVENSSYGLICEYGVILKDVKRDIYDALKEIHHKRYILKSINKRICTGKFAFWMEHLSKMQGLYERSCRDFYDES